MDSAFGVRTCCSKWQRLSPTISSRGLCSFTSYLLSIIYREVILIHRKVRVFILFCLLHLENCSSTACWKDYLFPTPKCHGTFAENQRSIKEGFISRLSILTHQSTGPSLRQCHNTLITEVLKSSSMKSSDTVALFQNSLGYPKYFDFRITLSISTKHLFWRVFGYYFLKYFFSHFLSSGVWQCPTGLGALFIFFRFFFFFFKLVLHSHNFYCSIFKLTDSSAVLNPLFKSSSDIFHFQYCTLQFHFHVALFDNFSNLYWESLCLGFCCHSLLSYFLSFFFF